MGLCASKARAFSYAMECYAREAWRDLRELWGDSTEDVLNGSTFILFKPDAVAFRSIGSCLAHLEKQGFIPTAAHRFRLTRVTMRELWRYELNIATLQRLDAIDLLLTASDSLLVALRDERWSPDAQACASARLKELKGPAIRELREPQHLRTVIDSGTSMLNNVHTPDDTAQYVREFGLLMDQPERLRVGRHLADTSVSPGLEALAEELYASTPAHDLQLAGVVARIRSALRSVEVSSDSAVIERACDEVEATGRTDWRPVLDAIRRAHLPIERWDTIVFAAATTECDEPGVTLAFKAWDQLFQARNSAAEPLLRRPTGAEAGQVPRPEHRNFIGKGDFVYRNGDDPAVFVRAFGSRLVDLKGLTYLDAEAANGTVGLGYDPDLLEDAIHRVRELPGAPSFVESAIRLRVAQRLAARFERATGLKGRVTFELGGAQAMELALKIAKANRPGQQYVVFEGAYHGRSIHTAQFSASSRYRALLDSKERVVRLPKPDCEKCRFGQERASCSLECVEFARRTFVDEACGARGDDTVAMVVEPVLNVGGMVYPDAEAMRGLLQATRADGALLIVDEIFSGMYRTGREWGFQHYDMVPDIVVFSKALSNGLVPVSGVWAREPLLAPEHFPPSTHSVTYGNNPLCLAVVDAVLDRYELAIEGTRTLETLEQNLQEALQWLQSRHPVIEVATARGATGRLRLSRPIAANVRAAALHGGVDSPIDGCHGLLVASTGMAKDVVCLHPPFTFTKGDVSTMAKLLDRAFAQASAVHG